MAQKFVLLGSLLAIGVLIGCSAVRSDSTTAVAPPSNPQFKNLKVLHPASRDELIATMKGIAGSLGVRCDFCHAARTDDPSKLDFPSDAKPEKDVARAMMRMTRDINEQYIAKLPEQEATVNCMTCHRGHHIPEMLEPPPPPPPPGHPGA